METKTVLRKEDQLEIKFGWTDKVIISMKQLMKEAKNLYDLKSINFTDGTKKRCISWMQATKEIFAEYRSWKQLFKESGNTRTMPSFVYFID